VLRQLLHRCLGLHVGRLELLSAEFPLYLWICGSGNDGYGPAVVGGLSGGFAGHIIVDRFFDAAMKGCWSAPLRELQLAWSLARNR
jgi:hypothetical protein